MAKIFTHEELDQRIHKLDRIDLNVAFHWPRRWIMITLVCFFFLLAAPWGELCFAVESLPGRTILAKGSDSYVPYSFLNKEGEVDGFDNDLFQAVIEAAGLKAKIELESGKIDVISGMYYSK